VASLQLGTRIPVKMRREKAEFLGYPERVVREVYFPLVATRDPSSEDFVVSHLDWLLR
jgi:hypothetical protein